MNLSFQYSLLFVDRVVNAYVSLVEFLVEGVTGIIGQLTTGLIETILFMPQPSQMGLNDLYWGYSFPMFWALLTVVASAFFLLIQLFPESDKADLDRFMQRSMIAVIMVLIVGMGGFDYLIQFFNAIGQELFPTEEYQIAVDMTTIEGIATAAFTGVTAALVILFTTPKILLTFGLFLLMLGVRAVVIYTTFVLFPILIVFWISDLGPLGYLNMLAKFMFKATILLLFLGIFISLILGMSSDIAGDALSNPEIQQDYEPIDRTPVEGDRVSGGALTDTTPQFASSGMGAITGAWFSVFAYLAGLWLCITLTTTLLGGTVSPGLGKNVAKGAKIQKKAGSIKDRINDARGGNDSGSDDSSLTDGMGVKPDDGNEDDDGEAISDDSAPEPENDDESAWDSVKSRYTDAKEEVSDRTEPIKEKGEDIKEKGEDFAEEHPEIKDSALKAVGGLKKGSNLVKKGANLGKRGAKAGYSIWNQKSAMDTLGEAGRIARQSPIGAPPEDWGSAGKEDQKESLGEGPVTLEEVANGFGDKGRDDQDRHNTQFPLDGTFEFTHEDEFEISDGDGGTKNMQKGYITDTETGTEMPYVGFGDFENGEGTKLEDGEQYEFGSGMECRPYQISNSNNASQHGHIPEQFKFTKEDDNGRTTEHYNQACATEHTSVNKVSDRSKGN